MAIPGWLWPEDHAEEQSELGLSNVDKTPEATEIENATNAFGVLSNTARLEILASLYACAEPISYTELRESTSVEDKGRFNYHLRQLERLTRSEEGQYSLNQRGKELVQNVLTEEHILHYE